MATIARVTTWVSQQILTAATLNGEFNNIINVWNNHNSGSSTWDTVKATSSSAVPLVANSTGSVDSFNAQSSGTNTFVVANSGIWTSASQSGVRAYRGTNQSMTLGGAAKITLDTKSYDVKTEFDAVTNNRFTATVTGKYHISAKIRISPTGTGAHKLYIYVNGVEYTSAIRWLDSVNTTDLAYSDTIALNATDYVELFFSCDANCTIVGGSIQSYMAINKVA